ncbi:MAG: hypothetical protein WD273_11870 [Trueperaceae bacterium]
MNRHSPHARARSLRRTASQLIFAWGSVISAAWYALLTILGQPPLIDDHLTVTALAMLSSYIAARTLLDLWRHRSETRPRSER